MRPATLVDMLEEVVVRAGQRGIRFPTQEDELLTYADLNEASKHWASALARCGIGKGDGVGILLPTSPDFVSAFFGVLRAGGVVSPLVLTGSARGATDRVRQFAQAFHRDGIRGVIASPELARAISQAGVDIRVLTVADLAAAAAAPIPSPTIGPDDLALLQYTSGSTSSPKGVVLAHRNVLASIAAVRHSVHLTQEDVNVQWLPLYHDMGLIGVLTFISAGMNQVLFRPTSFVRDPAAWLMKFAALGGTILSGPNFSFELMLSAVTDAQLARMNLSRWRVAFNGAEHVDLACVERFQARFGPAGLGPHVMCPCYGLAEATVAVAVASPDEPVQALWVAREPLTREGRVEIVPHGSSRGRPIVACGRAVLDHEVRIVGPDGASRPESSAGEIEVRGPAVFQGYRSLEEETRATLRDGWLRTGDLGFLLGGQLYISGRLKDTVIVRGTKYFAEDVERLVRPLWGVHGGRCVAVELAERMVVLAETEIHDEPGRAELVETIRREVTSRLGLAELTVLPVAPRLLAQTTSGKFRRTHIRELLRAAWRGQEVFDAPWGRAL